MRRLITLISAGRNRTIVIRRELPRTKDAGWAMEPYRIKGRRILLSVSPRPVTSTVALPYAEASMRRSARTKPAIPSSQPMGFSHRRRVPSRPSGSERQRAAASRRAALTGGAGARRSKWREWQAWSWLSGLRFCLEFGLRADGNGPDEAQQLTARSQSQSAVCLFLWRRASCNGYTNATELSGTAPFGKIPRRHHGSGDL